MSNVLDVADLKVILMLCLAQQVFVRELFAKYVVVLINKDILDIPLTKLIVIIIHQIFEIMDGYE